MEKHKTIYGNRRETHKNVNENGKMPIALKPGRNLETWGKFSKSWIEYIYSEQDIIE